MINLMDFFFGTADNHYRTARIWITHNDLDGYGCLVVANVLTQNAYANHSFDYDRDGREMFPIQAKKLNIGTPNMALNHVKAYEPDHTMFLITDLRINRETIDYLINNKYQFVVVDHHVWTDEDYDTVKEYSPYSVISTKYSATKMLYNKFGYESAVRFGVKLENEGLEKYADNVSNYDTGNWGNWSKRDLGHLAKIGFANNKYTPALKEQLIFSNHKTPFQRVTYCKMVAKQFYTGVDDNVKERLDKELYSLAEKAFDKIYEQYEFVMKNLMTTDLYENSILVPFSVPFISVIAKKILEDNPKFNYLFYISPEYKMIGIRSSIAHPELNCQEIATKYGGGGHQCAAGFNLTSLDIYVSGGNASFRFTPADKDTIK